MPKAAEVKTTRGTHFYFRTSNDAVVKTVPQGGLNIADCEIRGEGSYVLVPPSVINGYHYFWESPLADGVTEFKDIPNELFLNDTPRVVETTPLLLLVQSRRLNQQRGHQARPHSYWRSLNRWRTAV